MSRPPWALLDERLHSMARARVKALALMTRIAPAWEKGVKALRGADPRGIEGACSVQLKADDDVSEI